MYPFRISSQRMEKDLWRITGEFPGQAYKEERNETQWTDGGGDGGCGTWVSQVRGLGCEGAGYEAQQAWGQWRQQGPNRELYASTQHAQRRVSEG